MANKTTPSIERIASAIKYILEIGADALPIDTRAEGTAVHSEKEYGKESRKGQVIDRARSPVRAS